jgi:ATP-dependent Lon protease
VSDKQALLAELNPIRRLEMTFAFMEGELGVLQVEKKIRSRVKRQMEKTQREYYLKEQLKAIQRELGNEGEEGEGDELAELTRKIAKTKLSKEARSKATQELKKLKAMAPMSAEATVSRNYLDVLLGLPWGKKSKLKHDIGEAQRILDEDHYGLEKVKDRIVEYLAVQARTNKLKGPILCLVGPPVSARPRSAARSRRRRAASSCASRWAACATRPRYAATAAPISARCRARSCRTSRSWHVQPALPARRDRQARPGFPRRSGLGAAGSARPEQNSKFQDHYLELDYDLSDIMFVTTANSLNLPQPLLDRMEIIRLEGYTEDEKVEIATRHLIDKQVESHGLKDGELVFTEAGLRDLIRYYTREAGVRPSSARSPRSLARRCGRFWKARPRRLSSRRKTSPTLPVYGNSAMVPARKRTRSVRSPAWPGPRWVANC